MGDGGLRGLSGARQLIRALWSRDVLAAVLPLAVATVAPPMGYVAQMGYYWAVWHDPFSSLGAQASAPSRRE